MCKSDLFSFQHLIVIYLHGPMFDYSRKFLSWNILLYALLFDISRPTLLFYYVNSKLLCLNPGVLE